jgi:hypothetical protein
VTAQPIAVMVTRHKCPFCPRTAARPGRAREHIARCWFNPEARGCKTCKHFEQDPGGAQIGLVGGEWCNEGVDLTGRPACPGCGGHGLMGISCGAQVPCGPERCTGHVGDGSEIKPGPIVHCAKWEAA